MSSSQNEDLKNDGEELLGVLIPSALTKLELEGGFLPFGAAVRSNGDVVPLRGGGNGAPLSDDELIDMLVDSIRKDAEAGRVRCFAICANVKEAREDLDLEVDAIRVFMERRDGEAMSVYVPYSKTKEGKIEKSPIYAKEANPRVFSVG